MTENYVGNSYAPTDHADIYFAKKDIRPNYTVMGKLIMDADPGTDSGKIQDQIETTAESKGADGVLITSFNKVKVGANTDYDGFGWGDVGMGGFYEGWGPGFGSGFASTDYVQDLRIIAFFLKYTDAPAPQLPVPAPYSESGVPSR